MPDAAISVSTVGLFGRHDVHCFVLVSFIFLLPAQCVLLLTMLSDCFTDTIALPLISPLKRNEPIELHFLRHNSVMTERGAETISFQAWGFGSSSFLIPRACFCAHITILEELHFYCRKVKGLEGSAKWPRRQGFSTFGFERIGCRSCRGSQSVLRRIRTMKSVDLIEIAAALTAVLRCAYPCWLNGLQCCLVEAYAESFNISFIQHKCYFVIFRASVILLSGHYRHL